MAAWGSQWPLDSAVFFASWIRGVIYSNGEKGVGDHSAVRTCTQTRVSRDEPSLTDAALARSDAAEAKLVRSGSRGVSPRDGLSERVDIKEASSRW